jgi:hypothetical protein
MGKVIPVFSQEPNHILSNGMVERKIAVYVDSPSISSPQHQDVMHCPIDSYMSAFDSHNSKPARKQIPMLDLLSLLALIGAALFLFWTGFFREFLSML